ncbi:MAG: 2-isopropylmalate synthase [Caldicoprobacterales bacterium]|jgi:2-isopropylmalate synthase|nr:2-isopropylmalate synthase [Clostridiales bacterium]
MADHIAVFDTTLRDGEQSPGISLNMQEKLEIARQLESLGVDVIEAGFPISSKGDFEGVRLISQQIRKPVIAALARAVRQDIDRAWEAVQEAARPRIHTFIATSDIHMKYKLRMEPEAVLKRAAEMVSYARSLCPQVEFSPEDGSRTRPEFLYQVLEEVIRAGADVLNIPDTVGYSTPEEFGALIRGIQKNVRGIDNVVLSVHCHNDLGLAVANTLAALENGARQVECTINGLGERAGNAALEELVMALRTRKDFYHFQTNIVTEQIYRTSSLVSSLTGVHVQPNKAIVGTNAFAHESGIHQHGIMTNRETYEIMTPESIGLKKSQMVLGKHSGRHAFEERLQELGFHHLSADDVNDAFQKFKDLADKKKVVTDSDIEALVSEELVQIPEALQLKYYHVSSGNSLIATASVRISREGRTVEEAACGDGPIDALFHAVERAAGLDVNLKDYRIRAITSGKDALGEGTVKVEKDGRNYVGRGVSTDIIEASVKAYINAINKMLHDISQNPNNSDRQKEAIEAV